jgi:hypothetical protein
MESIDNREFYKKDLAFENLKFNNEKPLTEEYLELRRAD